MWYWKERKARKADVYLSPKQLDEKVVNLQLSRFRSDAQCPTQELAVSHGFNVLSRFRGRPHQASDDLSVFPVGHGVFVPAAGRQGCCLPLTRELNEKMANFHPPALSAALNVPTQNGKILEDSKLKHLQEGTLPVLSCRVQATVSACTLDGYFQYWKILVRCYFSRDSRWFAFSLPMFLVLACSLANVMQLRPSGVDGGRLGGSH